MRLSRPHFNKTVSLPQRGNQPTDRVHVIKFDIAGAERYARAGAAHTIRTYQSTLAISAYHSPDDPFVIGEQIQAISGDHKFLMTPVCRNHGATTMLCPRNDRTLQPPRAIGNLAASARKQRRHHTFAGQWQVT
jgi:hypothetical protein